MSPVNGLEGRLISIFPPGFDSVPSESTGSSVKKPYTHTTEQLFTALINNYSPIAPSESIIVKVAWYGKQTESPKHEFLLFQVEDKREEEKLGKGLINYLVLDRNVVGKSTKHGKSLGYSRTSVKGGQAVDNFKVSYDGDLEKLLSGCELNPHRLVERLQFPSDQPFLLYELATLAHVVSEQHPDYNAVNSSCYFFAGLVWDSLHKLCPGAILEKALQKERGKHSWFRLLVDKSKVEATCEVTTKRVSTAKSKIESQKEQLDRLVEERIAKLQIQQS